MREFKFRAWNEKIKWMSKPFTFGQALNFHDQIIKSLSDDEIVMQFTGLKDKNGIDIYEGDIVKTRHQELAKVIWHQQFACFCFETIDDIVKEEYQFSFKPSEIEILGNLYENPELL